MMLAVSLPVEVILTGLDFLQEAEPRMQEARIRTKRVRYENGLRMVIISMDKNREIISGLPADKVHDRILIADADGNGGLAQLDGVAIDRANMAERDDIGLVNAD